MTDLGRPPAPTGEGDAATRDLWASLRELTAARIGLGRSGDALPTRAVLDFNLAHAQARDSVHAALDVDSLAQALAPDPVLRVASAAPDRATYLRRPDLGRRLDPDSRALLEAAAGAPVDLVFVIADGLSATAVATQAAGVIAACRARIQAAGPGWRVAPLVIATQARVALSDEVGALLGARLCAILIGERPGLSVADSLGIYLTYDPRPGRRDSERNCISNIHDRGGLTHAAAADKLVWLMGQALRRGTTGITLKDDEAALPQASEPVQPALP